MTEKDIQRLIKLIHCSPNDITIVANNEYDEYHINDIIWKTQTNSEGIMTSEIVIKIS